MKRLMISRALGSSPPTLKLRRDTRFCNPTPKALAKAVVVGSGLGANQLVVFVNAMNEMGKIFESPVKLEKKVFKFEPMLLAA